LVKSPAPLPDLLMHYLLNETEDAEEAPRRRVDFEIEQALAGQRGRELSEPVSGLGAFIRPATRPRLRARSEIDIRGRHA